jgi:hypothetical protein
LARTASSRTTTEFNNNGDGDDNRIGFSPPSSSFLPFPPFPSNMVFSRCRSPCVLLLLLVVMVVVVLHFPLRGDLRGGVAVFSLLLP